VTRAQRLGRVVLWVGVVTSAVLLECSAILAITTRDAGPYYRLPPDVTWGAMRGSYAMATPLEGGGRYPYEAWGELFDKSVLGFNLRVASSGLPHTYMRVTMVRIPCWLVAALSGVVMYWCARRLGMTFVWRRREPRGFDAIVPGEVTPPLPAARIEESASSGPSR
jgi:hypothetical protein